MMLIPSLPKTKMQMCAFCYIPVPIFIIYNIFYFEMFSKFMNAKKYLKHILHDIERDILWNVKYSQN